MQKLLDRVHDGITTFEYNQKNIPCIILSEQRFHEIMSKVAGKPVSVDTNLNILQDGQGHVFVEIVLSFSKGINETILVYANTSVEFFELLAQTSMLALTPIHLTEENIFMIQLPKPEKAIEALDIIRNGLECNHTE